MTTRLAHPEDETLRDLTRKLAADTSRLVRQEAELTKRELTEKLFRARHETAKAAAAGAVTLVGSLAVLAGLILLLAHVISLWLSALILGVAVAALGTTMLGRINRNIALLDQELQHPIDRRAHDATHLKEAV